MENQRRNVKKYEEHFMLLKC